jgi:predicted PolB exonuclease-like 3'-5' exonuclease
MDAEAAEKQVEKMALDPMLGRIICISFVGDGEMRETRTADALTDEAETALIHWAMSFLGFDEARLITWNGLGFDLPYIYKRCVMLGIHPGNFGAPPLSAWTKRYSTEKHIDLMQVFGGWNSAAFTKLDAVAGLVLGDHKNEVDVTKFPEMMQTEGGRKEIAEYCEQDTALTYRLFERMHGVLFV